MVVQKELSKCNVCFFFISSYTHASKRCSRYRLLKLPSVTRVLAPRALHPNVIDVNSRAEETELLRAWAMLASQPSHVFLHPA